jgi:type IX secretion system PorP/SprF family membrane protein
MPEKLPETDIIKILNGHILKKKTTPRLTVALIAWMLLIGWQLPAQDIHFSQFYNAPMSLNPALTGMSGDLAFSGNYRRQWFSADVPYETFFASGEKRFYQKNNENRFFGGGLVFFNDVSGDAELSLTHIALSGSYTYDIDDENFLSAGVSLGFNQRSLDPAKLTFDEQYIDGVFLPSNPITEDFSNTNNFYVNTAVGVNYHGRQDTTRSTLNAGIGLFHLNQPDQRFFEAGDKAPLPMRASLYIMPTIEIAERWDLMAAGSAQFQSSYFEALAVLGGRFWFKSKNPATATSLQGGLGLRFNSFGDALIPHIQVQVGPWIGGFSWDINISEFDIATNGNGGPEFSIRYLFTPLRLTQTRICRLQ